MAGRMTLTPRVEDYLHRHPTQAFKPTEVQRALGAPSAGAVSASMKRLAGDGKVRLATAKPQRYRWIDVDHDRPGTGWREEDGRAFALRVEGLATEYLAGQRASGQPPSLTGFGARLIYEVGVRDGEQRAAGGAAAS